MSDTGTVLEQLWVWVKSKGIPVLRTLLDTMDVAGAVLTAAALRTLRGHRRMHRRRRTLVLTGPRLHWVATSFSTKIAARLIPPVVAG